MIYSLKTLQSLIYLSNLNLLRLQSFKVIFFLDETWTALNLQHLIDLFKDKVCSSVCNQKWPCILTTFPQANVMYYSWFFLSIYCFRWGICYMTNRHFMIIIMAQRNILQWMESLWSEHNLYPACCIQHAIFFHRVLFTLNQHSLLKKASGTVHSHKHSHILIFQLAGPLFSKHMQTQQGIL